MTVPRILIVEDEIALSEVVRDCVIADGMAVGILPEGTQAVATALRGQHDLPVFDLMLPDVDGLTICREVRETSDVPIIMTTEKVEKIDRLVGLSLGAGD